MLVQGLLGGTAVLTAAVILIVMVGNPQAGAARGSAQTWAAVAAVLVPLLIGCVVAARIRGGDVRRYTVSDVGPA